jgi:hypothetical protein
VLEALRHRAVIRGDDRGGSPPLLLHAIDGFSRELGDIRTRLDSLPPR